MATDTTCSLKIAVVGGPQYDRLYERLALFEQETGHRVEIAFKGSHPELNDYLAATFASYGSSNSHPELDLVSTHIKYAPSQAHFLQELDETMVTEQERAAFLPAALEASKIQDRLMQLPRMVDSRVLFYRDDVFERLGLQPPATWRDLLHCASTIHRANVPTTTDPKSKVMQGYVFPGKLSGLFGTFYELALMEMQQGEALFDRKDRPVFEEAVVAEVLRYMRELVSSGAVPQDLEDYYFDEVSALFAEGKVAMVADWPSFYKEMKRALKHQPGARVKVMQYPVGANRKRSAYSGMHSFAIPKSCRYPKQALQLLKFLVRDDQQWIEASESGSFPTKKSVLQRLVEETEARTRDVGDKDATLDSERLRCLEATVQHDMAMFPHLISYPELEDALYLMIQDAMMGRVTPEKAARSMRVKAMQLAQQ
ncbi:hypothetical protein KVV02_005562 [Mortierella alpina]|uniref:Extracellular solute-binding protein n=1 Tax=Mortierella alpina TaxID=64518 RepID=A0A9P7ZWX9_MORAP|nr:hypothetical protein KVV02_005562 [Mortierella alpina]